MTEENLTLKENLKTHCFNCQKETNQDILFQDKRIEPREIIIRNENGDENQSVWEVIANIWYISKCRGCEEINFKHIIRNSPNRETDNVFHYPRKPIRKVPNWITKLPMKYVEIFQEIYISINEELSILALTGIRTLLDIYIVDKIGDNGSFNQKLNQLVSKNIITTAKSKVLATAIDAGNASAHRGYKPDKETLFQILDIVENLLLSEIVDRNASQIKIKTPQRK